MPRASLIVLLSVVSLSHRHLAQGQGLTVNSSLCQDRTIELSPQSNIVQETIIVPNATFNGVIVPPTSFGGDVISLTTTTYSLTEGPSRFIYNYEFDGFTATCDFTIFVIAVTPCFPNPCNGGVCTVINAAASCNCLETFFTGQFCNIPIQVQFQNTGPLTIVEGNIGTRDVCLDPPIARSVDVPFLLSVAPLNDIQILTQTVIPPNVLCLSVDFLATADGIPENEETFQVSLSTSSNVTVDLNSNQFTVIVPSDEFCNPNPCNSGSCSVSNNAPLCNCAPTVNVGQFCTLPIQIQFQDITLLTIDEGKLRIRDICLDPPVARDFAVAFSLGPPVADLTFPTSSSIPVGETCTSVQITSINDGIPENEEEFQIFLTSQTVAVDTNQNQLTVNVPPQGGACTPNPCNGGICTDQGNSFVCDCSGTTFVGAQCNVVIEIQFSALTATGREGDGSLTFAVCLDPQLPRTFDIPFGLITTTSVAGDLTVPPFGIINANMQCAEETVGIVDDTIIESTETFNVIIASSSPGISIDRNHNTLAITIIDNDVDSTPPVVTCPGDITRTIAILTGGTTVNFVDATAVDNSGVVIMSFRSHSPGSFFVTGSTTVTYTFEDPSGNSASCSFQVTLTEADTDSPVLNCPEDIFQGVPSGTSTKAVTFTQPTAFDNIDGPATEVSRTHTSGDLFPVGTTTVTYVFSDRDNNFASCSFRVIVFIGETGPEVSMCPTSMTFSTCDMEYEVSWTPPEVVNSSDSDLVSISSSHSPGDTFKIGNTVVIYTFEDQFGNVAQCNFQISVNQSTDHCGLRMYIIYIVVAAVAFFGLVLTTILLIVCTIYYKKINNDGRQYRDSSINQMSAKNRRTGSDSYSRNINLHMIRHDNPMGNSYESLDTGYINVGRE